MTHAERRSNNGTKCGISETQMLCEQMKQTGRQLIDLHVHLVLLHYISKGLVKTINLLPTNWYENI